jgi:hypothetical protein
VHEAKPPGSADLEDPVDGGRGPAGLVERGARREDVAGVEADAGLRVEVERAQVGIEVLDAGTQRAALPGRGLEQEPRGGVPVAEGLEDREQALANLAHRRRVAPLALLRVAGGIDERPGVDDDALGSDLDGPAQVVGDHRGRARVRRGRGGAEVDEVRRVDERSHPAGADRVPERGVLGGPAGRMGPAPGIADEDLQGLALELDGLRQSACGEALAHGHVRADRVAEGGVDWHARRLGGSVLLSHIDESATGLEASDGRWQPRRRL